MNRPTTRPDRGPVEALRREAARVNLAVRALEQALPAAVRSKQAMPAAALADLVDARRRLAAVLAALRVEVPAG